jgi:hypothetical protein
MVDFLVGLAGGGPVLVFAIGTGRVALPLRAKGSQGVAVHGLELSRPMAAQLAAKPGADGIPVTIGDRTTTRSPAGPCALGLLVANTIMNERSTAPARKEECHTSGAQWLTCLASASSSASL